MIGYGRRRYGLLEGDLVEVISPGRTIPRESREDGSIPMDDYKSLTGQAGIILTIYDSNVYEGASADVLVGNSVIWCEAKNLTVLEKSDS
tara:strand:- start:801 stop:1070 length:270 start_codon:yes stop_codon:yes gene_type:complete